MVSYVRGDPFGGRTWNAVIEELIRLSELLDDEEVDDA
jgi:hypothetical protein